MKKVIILFLAVIILMQCSMKLAIVAYYQLNKDYISANLCENRSKPEKQCNGKCYLTKKLKTQDEKESKFPSLLKQVESVVLYFTPFEIVFQCISHKTKALLNSFYLIKSYRSPLVAIFQPPQ